MRKIRADIATHDSAENFGKGYGLDIFKGNAYFKDKNTIIVNGKEIKFLRACICSGARPKVPTDIQGLESIPYFTSENVFNLTQ